MYSFLHYLLMPFILLRLFLRSRKAPAYRDRWRERFGFGPNLPTEKPGIWIHAVSVGEVQAALPLTHALLARYPKSHILVTTTTPTGAALVARALGAAVTHRYAPYDLPDCVGRFLDRANPSLVLILETELWPNLLLACGKRSLPVILVNARMSARSARGYGRIGKTTRAMLANLTAIAAQGRADADRLIKLGADPARVGITGSIKFDVEIPPHTRDAGRELRQYWGENRPVWIAASTHEGEEEGILAAFRMVRQSIPDCLLILAPRHPERFSRVATLVRDHGYRTLTRSQLPRADAAPRATTAPTSPCPDVEVLVGDTMGEMLLLYAASHVAFVGGSLLPIGGHNPLEPAALGIPTLFGQHMFNFLEIAQNLCRHGGARQVADETALADALIALLRHAHARHEMGTKAADFVADNRGALDRIMAMIQGVYPSDHPPEAPFEA